MATRPSTSSRSSAGQRGGTATRPASRPAGRRGTAPRKPPPRGKQRGGGLPLPLRAVRGTWMGMAHVAGDVIHAVVAGTFGRVSYAVPLALLFLGVRLLRAPQDATANSRIGIGLGALAFAASGLAHVAKGVPTPPEGADLMRDAGGIT